MAWECAECGVSEGRDNVSVDVVCHHCGKPLCQAHRSLIADEAFRGAAVADRPNAFHCEDCRKRYHPKSVVIEGARRTK